MSPLHITDAVCESWSLDTHTGLRVCVPPSMRSPSTYVLLEQEHWLAPELSLLPRLLHGQMHALDISAGHGHYALEMARCLPDGHVWAFEAQDGARSLLQRSVVLNDFEAQVTVLDVAPADCSGLFSRVPHEDDPASVPPLAPADTSPVRTLTLDDFTAGMATRAAIALLRLDGNCGLGSGHELRVLDGAQRFFEQQSPVVLCALRGADGEPQFGLFERLHALGYELFRWSAELKLLLPLDAVHDETTFVLNVLAVRRAQQQDLAQRGLLVTRDALRAVQTTSPDPRALQAWCTLSDQPPPAVPDASDFAGQAYLQALAAVAAAHLQPGLSPAQRVSLMIDARNLLLPALQASEHGLAEAWVLIVHTLHALGQRQAALQMADELLQRWPKAHGQDALTWPFVAPQLSDLDRARSTDAASWLHQMLAEFVALRSSHSAWFDAPAPQRWQALLAHPDHSAEIERRYLLAHMVQDRVAPLAGVCRLPSPDATSNPALWQSLLQATRAMGREGDIGRTQPAQRPVDAVLQRLPVATVQVVDVGASSRGPENAPENAPYAPLLRAGRARVTGFEPDADALAYLRQHFPNPHTHRFLPAVLGDGATAIFHLTEHAMADSLLEPNRRQLDRYHHLGSQVRERARRPVHTTRLDTLIAPGGMDVLKIDVQGAEGLVFDGAQARLDECLVVWTEVRFVSLYREQPLFGDIAAQLRQHGLQFMCFAGISQRALSSWPLGGVPTPQRQQQLWAEAIFVPQAERIELMDEQSAARLALIAHHMLAAQDLCHAALQRYDRVTGSDYALRYLDAMVEA